MKKLYTNSLYLVLLSLLCSAQFSLAQNFNDKGFSFQGYAKNTEGAALSDQNIEVQFSVYQQGQAAEFSEVHTTTTDAFGVFHLVVGTVNSTDFKGLDFISKADYKLKVETRVLGGTYATISDAVMQSVPYAQAADNGVPVGSMIIFAGPKANIPAGWLPCDGASVSSNDYPKLFAALGTAWGDGSESRYVGTPGSGDFNVPDMRGFFPRGVNEGSGRDPNATTRTATWPGGNTGDKVGSYQADEIESHNHNITDPGHTHVNGNFNSIMNKELSTLVTLAKDVNQFPIEALDGGSSVMPSSTTGISINNNGGAETRPMNVGVWYIIRAR